MFQVLKQSLKTGVVTTNYPLSTPELSPNVRGRPEIDWKTLRDARVLAPVCPTGAFAVADDANGRTVEFDLGKCTYCGLCADVDPAIRMTPRIECATKSRAALISKAIFKINPDSSQGSLLNFSAPNSVEASSPAQAGSLDRLGALIAAKAKKMFGRSLHIRQVDAGSCNGCENEIVNLNSPIYDIERFGIHFVASPRQADMLLVTGPVTRNMELALKNTYAATPDPKIVVAVGACGCSGGIFGLNYATCGSVDTVIPVDVYIPGCPPNPYALLHGILHAIGKLPQRA